MVVVLPLCKGVHKRWKANGLNDGNGEDEEARERGVGNRLGPGLELGKHEKG
jgi:hypothetical protein